MDEATQKLLMKAIRKAKGLKRIRTYFHKCWKKNYKTIDMWIEFDLWLPCQIKQHRFVKTFRIELEISPKTYRCSFDIIPSLSFMDNVWVRVHVLSLHWMKTHIRFQKKMGIEKWETRF